MKFHASQKPNLQNKYRKDNDSQSTSQASVIFLERRISNEEIRTFFHTLFNSKLFQSKKFIIAFCILCSFIFIFNQIPNLYDRDIDSPSYYTAAKGIQKGINIYEEQEFQEFAVSEYGKVFIVYPYVYPPIVAQILIPLTNVSFKKFKYILLFINIILAFICLYLTSQILELHSIQTKLPFFFLFSLLIYNVPLYENIRLGQINLWVLMFILASIYFDKKQKSYFSSLFLILAVLFKVFPAVFLLFYAFQKRYRYLAYSLANGFLIVLISIVVSGISYWTNFIKLLYRTFFLGIKPVYFFDFTTFVYNTSLKTFITRLFMRLNLPLQYISATYFFILIGTLIIAFKAIRKFIRSSDYNFYTSVLLLIPLLISSMCWDHHYVNIMFPLVFLVVLIVQKKDYFSFLYLLPLTLIFLAYPRAGGFPFNHLRLFSTVLLLILLIHVHGKKEKNISEISRTTMG